MNTTEYIKHEIEKLYNNNPIIHITLKITRPKSELEKSTVKITGVYKNIFQVEENRKGALLRHTFQYSDILIGRVAIEELGYIPM